MSETPRTQALAGQDQEAQAKPALAGETYDVVVVGGGAAGLSGALALSRARRSVLVVDGGDPRNAPAGHVHNYLGREGTPPAELYAIGRSEIESYGAAVAEGFVAGIAREDGGLFAVELTGGRLVRARRILAATGVTDVLPEVPGLREYWGTGVLHCPYCHGWEVRDQAIGVLSTELPTAVHQALMWRQWSADVVLFLNGTGEPDAGQAEQLAARGIRVVPGEVAGIEGTDRLTGVRLVDGSVEARDAVVVFTRLSARADYLAGLGVVPTEQFAGETSIGTALTVNPMGATDVPGIYAAGNLAAPMAQVIGAAAAGLMAGAAINGDLIMEDTALAVAARV
ncbi:NAD(P)/FAD-dependent oxidoreductase [Arthrobacter sp. Sa2CUA1]|uniref:NAD(P)/FAD-dependent oxidoreductase n=1 Tax=Arthrobacter gallicola TaxID=2762225 RepID=A0ABR8UN48_9MICC|nr:NAD(P)/FAD-dependent oxidoreductase [Arthrobacter gallicola]MBD7993964.1 NAD(P)/FAD-dependent oxidoreductase [Arthrobacter gallicola]